MRGSPSVVVAFAVGATVLACGASRADAPAMPDTGEPTKPTAEAGTLAFPRPERSVAPVEPAPADAAIPPPPPASDGGRDVPEVRKVKVVTIGMHVAGGPFDELTKEPFKKAVEPHLPEMAACWAKHVARPPKQADVGVDLLIEATGGRPKVSNPRSTLGKDAEGQGLVPCVVTVFESVEFPKLPDRGRTGVSYSLRFGP